MRLGWPEVLLILAVVLIVFGVGKLPQVGAQLGKGIREFRKAQMGGNEEIKEKRSDVGDGADVVAKKDNPG